MYEYKHVIALYDVIIVLFKTRGKYNVIKINTIIILIYNVIIIIYIIIN